MESGRQDGLGRLPIIDSAARFLEAMRAASGGKDPNDPNKRLYDEDAVKWLSSVFEDAMPAIDTEWKSRLTRYRMTFWTGAFVGLKVALRLYTRHLEYARQQAIEDYKLAQMETKGEG